MLLSLASKFPKNITYVHFQFHPLAGLNTCLSGVTSSGLHSIIPVNGKHGDDVPFMENPILIRKCLFWGLQNSKRMKEK
jgi:hypothetical protein